MNEDKYKPFEDVSIERKDDGIPLIAIILASISLIIWITFLVLLL